jgi:hypothetical protein
MVTHPLKYHTTGAVSLHIAISNKATAAASDDRLCNVTVLRLQQQELHHRCNLDTAAAAAKGIKKLLLEAAGGVALMKQHGKPRQPDKHLPECLSALGSQPRSSKSKHTPAAENACTT